MVFQTFFSVLFYRNFFLSYDYQKVQPSLKFSLFSLNNLHCYCHFIRADTKSTAASLLQVYIKSDYGFLLH